MSLTIQKYQDAISRGIIYPWQGAEAIPVESTTTTTTENGAKAYTTTGSPCLDFFSRVMARDKSTAMSDEDITSLLRDAWRESPILTLRLIAHLRDVREGKGERHAAEVCWRWLLANNPPLVKVNARHIPFYGRWSDLQDIFVGTSFLPAAMVILAERLLHDRKILTMVEECQEPGEARKLLATISLAAKWAPTEDCGDDIRARKLNKEAYPVPGYYLAVPSVMVARYLWENDGHGDIPPDMRGVMKNYRVRYLTPLRQAIGVVEGLLCAKRYDEIDFSKVPSVAMLRYARRCFPRNMPERFSQWRRDLLLGKAKINTSAVDPYQVVERFLAVGQTPIAQEELDTLEAFYTESIRELRAKGSAGRTCVVADTSGSMSGTPMTVSVAMAIWISACATEEWRDMFYSFNTIPEVVSLRGCTSLMEKVQRAQAAPWGGSTDLLATFRMILKQGRDNGYTAERMPSRLVIISDMQFNAACGPFTNLEVARELYREAGYDFPEIVFWNVRGDVSRGNGFPATSTEKGVAMISGFSKSMIDILLDNGPMPTAYDLMVKTLMNARYDLMTL
jgi:hypothetical protein